MRFSALVASVASLGIASVALADSASNNTAGSWASTGNYSSVIALPNVASIDSIVINLAHTWSSDLVIRVNGLSFNLWDGPLTDGSGSNFGSTTTGGTGGGTEPSPLAYWWGPTGIPANTVGLGGNGTAIPAGQANQIQAHTWLAGPQAAGNYTLTITDGVGGDGATISGWTINYTPVPAPGALALLGLAGMVGSRRRRA